MPAARPRARSDRRRRLHWPLGPLRAVAARLTLGALRTILAFGPLLPFRAFRAFLPLETLLALGADRPLLLVIVIAITGGRVLVLILILVGEVIVALTTLLLEAGAVLVQHTEIVIGELEIIFGLDAVALQLRVARERLVFLQELGGVTARAVILPVALARSLVRRAGSPAAAATAAVLTIVDQK